MKRLFVLLSISIILFSGCKHRVKYQRTPNGLPYAYIEQADTSSPTPKVGDNMVLNMKYMVNRNDSLLFDSDRFPSTYRLKLTEPTNPGGRSIEDGFSMMHVGDSMFFLVDALSFYANTRQDVLPTNIMLGEWLRFEVRLVAIQSDDEVAVERKKLLEKRKIDGQKELEKYLAENGDGFVRSESGLYKKILVEGSGEPPVDGDFLSLQYLGSELNGNVFLDTRTSGKLISFTMGEVTYIEGMNEAIAGMKMGEKSLFLMPSELAYGENEVMGIPAYAPVLYEISLVDIAKFHKEK